LQYARGMNSLTRHCVSKVPAGSTRDLLCQLLDLLQHSGAWCCGKPV
jgi:hypothetical protein